MHKIVRRVKDAVKRKTLAIRRVHVVTEAPVGKAFFVFGGPVCKTIDELVQALKSMSPIQYEYHTVPRGNDFAVWIRDVMGQKRLASRLLKATNQKEAIRILES